MKKTKIKKNKNQNQTKQENKKNKYDDIIVLKRKNTPKKKKVLNIPVKKIEYPQYICTKCELPINDLSLALGDKQNKNPLHFKCVFEFIKNSEEFKEKEDLIYIGNGNFAIVYIENPKNRKKFKIIKLIEWENKNKDYPWKLEIADLASKV